MDTLKIYNTFALNTYILGPGFQSTFSEYQQIFNKGFEKLIESFKYSILHDLPK